MNRPASSQEKIDPTQPTSSIESQFLALMDQYQDAIFRFIYFRLGNRPLAVDITQDTFTKTWQYLSSGKTIDYPEAFLYRAARNALIDYYKKGKTSSLDTLMEGGYDPATEGTVDEMFRNDTIALMRDLIGLLDEESQHIIFLRYTEEKPIEAIAALYGKTINAMTVQIHRIIKKLRTLYDQKHGT